MCILVPALFGTLFASIFWNGADYAFCANLASKFKNDAEIALSKIAIWDDFSEQHSTKASK